MTSTNITGLRKNLPEYFNQAIEFNDVINVSTENGNAVIISETDYNALLETLYLSSDSKVRQEIMDGKKLLLRSVFRKMRSAGDVYNILYQKIPERYTKAKGGKS